MSLQPNRHLLAVALALVLAQASFAADTPATPSGAEPKPACAILFGGGSPNVFVENQETARQGDGVCVEVIDGAQSVFTNGRPTLRVGDRVRCPNGRIGVIEGGAASVFIEGRPAATAASKVAGCEAP